MQRINRNHQVSTFIDWLQQQQGLTSHQRSLSQMLQPNNGQDQIIATPGEDSLLFLRNALNDLDNQQRQEFLAYFNELQSTRQTFPPPPGALSQRQQRIQYYIYAVWAFVFFSLAMSEPEARPFFTRLETSMAQYGSLQNAFNSLWLTAPEGIPQREYRQALNQIRNERGLITDVTFISAATFFVRRFFMIGGLLVALFSGVAGHFFATRTAPLAQRDIEVALQQALPGFTNFQELNANLVGIFQSVLHHHYTPPQLDALNSMMTSAFDKYQNAHGNFVNHARTLWLATMANHAQHTQRIQHYQGIPAAFLGGVLAIVALTLLLWFYTHVLNSFNSR